MPKCSYFFSIFIIHRLETTISSFYSEVKNVSPFFKTLKDISKKYSTISKGCMSTTYEGT